MKLFIGLLLSIALVGCSNNLALMTKDSFAEVDLGMDANELPELVGQPYSVKKLPDGSVEYHYIERFNRQQKVAMQNHYTIIVKDGVVIEKKVETAFPPAYDYIYYDDPIMKPY